MLLSLRASTVAAQDAAQSSLTFSYGSVRDREDATSSADPITYNPTLVVSFLGRGKGPVSGVAEFAWGQGAAIAPHAHGGLNGRERRMTFLGGARLSGRGNTSAFGQMLVGYARESFYIFANELNTSGVRSGGFVMQPGGGVDVALGKQAGVRLQGDLVFQSRDVLVESGETRRKLIRLTVGVVVFFPN